MPNDETRYTRDHEWVRIEGDRVTVGITDHAQEALGDVVFVELPDEGRVVAANEACAVVESVKAANDVYAPLAGTVAEVNRAVVDDPTLVNREPAAGGWFFRLGSIDTAAFAALMDEAAYRAYVETL